ncbi:hypothetical protein L227DRAFT_568087 [Lentinus tigrinus ALCF2SS1-6]|uniref:Uncharacterized protein n=1 Tax=Lentinus tigrinus ALCF2SS1-6 TaxID=1328759 RepID=A0A5C2RNN3_9APHY|nr:hypothetical protein L227DRAFT_568087 [Lentinus tigrinus ALCF2SS1-6]
MYEEWFAEWSECKAQFGHNDPDRLSEAELEQLAQAVKKRKQQLDIWHKNRDSALRRSATPRMSTLLSAAGVTKKTTRLPQAQEVYSRNHYKTDVLPHVQRQVKEMRAELGRDLTKGERLNTVKSCTKSAYERSSEEVKNEIENELKTARKNAAAAKASRALDLDAKNRTPIQFQDAVDLAPQVIESVFKPLSAASSWTFSILGAGPVPEQDGKISSLSAHFSHKESGASFAQATPNFEEQYLVPFGKYATQIFPRSVREQRSLHASSSDSSPTSTPEGLNSLPASGQSTPPDLSVNSVPSVGRTPVSGMRETPNGPAEASSIPSGCTPGVENPPPPPPPPAAPVAPPPHAQNEAFGTPQDALPELLGHVTGNVIVDPLTSDNLIPIDDMQIMDSAQISVMASAFAAADPQYASLFQPSSSDLGATTSNAHSLMSVPDPRVPPTTSFSPSEGSPTVPGFDTQTGSARPLESPAPSPSSEVELGLPSSASSSTAPAGDAELGSPSSASSSTAPAGDVELGSPSSASSSTAPAGDAELESESLASSTLAGGSGTSQTAPPNQREGRPHRATCAPRSADADWVSGARSHNPTKRKKPAPRPDMMIETYTDKLDSKPLKHTQEAIDMAGVGLVAKGIAGRVLHIEVDACDESEGGEKNMTELAVNQHVNITKS